MEDKKNLEKKESIFKKAGRKLGQGCEWLYEKRHWIGGIGAGLLVMYLKGRADESRWVHERFDEDEKSKMDFMKALVGDKTGLTEEQINQGLDIKDALDGMRIDMDKLYEIQEYYDEDAYRDFLNEYYS